MWLRLSFFFGNLPDVETLCESSMCTSPLVSHIVIKQSRIWFPAISFVFVLLKPVSCARIASNVEACIPLGGSSRYKSKHSSTHPWFCPFFSGTYQVSTHYAELQYMPPLWWLNSTLIKIHEVPYGKVCLFSSGTYPMSKHCVKVRCVHPLWCLTSLSNKVGYGSLP